MLNFIWVELGWNADNANDENKDKAEDKHTVENDEEKLQIEGFEESDGDELDETV